MTTGGRIAGVLMLIVGVALFATFSGFLANALLPVKQPTLEGEPSDAELRAMLREVERLNAEQQQALDRLRARVVELEQVT